MNDARVLVIGLGGLGAELCKNIILGGVKSVVLMDPLNVTENDASCQFLVSREAVGKNVIFIWFFLQFAHDKLISTEK